MLRRLGAHRSELLVAAAALAASAVYGVLGTGYVLDDWYSLANARFEGPWMAAGPEQLGARPGAWLTYAVLFGLLGGHPWTALAVQAVVFAATAVVLVVLLRRFLGPGPALAATIIWVVLPNHTSLEVWASATNIALCVLFTGLAALLLSGPLSPGARAAAVALLVAATLSYEAVLPLAAVVVVALPWLRSGRPDRPVIGGGAVALGLSAGWIVAHWNPGKTVEPTQAVGAHLGWGIAPSGLAEVSTVAGVAGAALVAGMLLLPERRALAVPTDWAVVAGVGVIVAGTVPFARYPYAPLGAGDRYNFVSAVGGALLWTGLLARLARWWRPLGAAALVVVLAGGLVVRVHRSVLWSRAGTDAEAIRWAAVAAHPPPVDRVVLGPTTIQEQNIAAYLDQSNVLGALRLAYDDPGVRVGIALRADQYESYPEAQRFDIRPWSTLVDDRR
jgi:hypothetical protein